MWHSPIPLPNVMDFEDWDVQKTMGDLPRIVPRFFVPSLENKPQNPILEALNLEAANANLPKRKSFQPPPQLPKELVVLTLDKDPFLDSGNRQKATEELWEGAVKRKPGVRAELLSWDRLRVTHSTRASSTPFLSEQDDGVYTSARFQVQPPFQDPLLITLHVAEDKLLDCLKRTILGISSTLHTWDNASESFVQIGTETSEKQGSILINGMDHIASSSYIAKFITIGTLLRRLERLVETLRARSAKEGPTIHAFAHALASCLMYLRNMLATCPPTRKAKTSGEEGLPLAAISYHYSIYKDILVALADLCMRGVELNPSKYPVFESAPIPLLSRIYEHLEQHIERQSSSIINAILAFILTSTSQEYIRSVSYSVGYGGQPPQRLSASRESRDPYEFGSDEEDDEEDILDLLERIDSDFPAFFPLNLRQILPAAQKSLILLNVAQSEHNLLHSSIVRSARWLWTVDQIEAAWNGTLVTHKLSTPSPLPVESSISSATQSDLAGFRLFNLEPGTSVDQTLLKTQDRSVESLQRFIGSFPKALPLITPTLSQLTTLVFQDLSLHSTTLSSTLLSLFINSTGILNFRSHLVLLRSYLLIAAPSFKSRLLAALFSDAGEYEVDRTPHTTSIRSLRRPNNKKDKESHQPWAVGISPNLLDRETWPPVGSDLSFFLRTVIVDSLDGDQDGKGQEDETLKRDQVVEEASWRLGFAIRDLPPGAGPDKWADPLSIEALDFLYMDYKAPRPLEILISPDILSKYQRMFAFLLRLLRVECALKSLFRMSTHRLVDEYLFPTLTQARKLLLHFRFIAHSFVSNLSGYVFDTVIGGNFDRFFARLSSDGTTAPPMYPTDPDKTSQFSDVFQLARSHSSLLDNILSACLLRSSQRDLSDLLRQCLEIVLEFSIIVAELHRGRLEEYQAAPLIQSLYHKFLAKMSTFTKVLKGLVDKSSLSAKLEGISALHSNSVGGLDALIHLLIRLDLGDWWSKRSTGDVSKTS